MPNISYSVDHSPFQEAIEFFANKIRLPSSGWTDIWQEQHSHAFVVAGATADSLVSDFYNALKRNQAEGKSYADFRKDFDEIVRKHGWTHNGSPGWRSKVIYQTNMRQAYNAGRYKQMVKVKELRPYWRYRHNSVEHPRLEHLAWDGLIIAADDPWWQTHMPQNGWGCKCEVESLSRYEAREAWEASGKNGPDTAPEIEWEDRVVGSRGSNPRVVRVPKGIDPGFAYNPGRAWLEPHTVPPLTGYDAVLAERKTAWPTGFVPPDLPVPTKVSASYLLSQDTPPVEAVRDFLDVFGASLDKGTVFYDKIGTPIAISKRLFVAGDDKDSDNFKWLSAEGKAHRLSFINFLAAALIEPDEIWWHWEKDRSKEGNWRLRRRYLRSFEIDGTGEYAIAAFEWGKNGWTGSTAFMAEPKKLEKRLKYFNNQRIGRLLYRK